jgi:hypothetical protein
MIPKVKFGLTPSGTVEIGRRATARGHPHLQPMMWSVSPQRPTVLLARKRCCPPRHARDISTVDESERTRNLRAKECNSAHEYFRFWRVIGNLLSF